MRARNIKPGFFKNEYLADCDPLARILFEALWCMSDREGRLELRPKRIKAEALPYDNCDILRLINQLIDRKFVTAYKYGDDLFLEIPTFRQHQTPHIKEQESTIPAPDKSESCTILVHLNPESISLNPESPLPHRKGVKVLKENLFEKFWSTYPKKKSKGDAENAFKKINPNDELVENMIKAINLAKTTEDWKKDHGQFIPYPATWLNRKAWEDEITVKLNPTTQPPEDTRPVFTKDRSGNWTDPKGNVVSAEEVKRKWNEWDSKHDLHKDVKNFLVQA